MIALGLVAAAMALATYGFGWSSVAAIGFAVGAARVSPRPAATAAAAGLLGWSALLVWRAASGHAGALAALLGEIMGAPSVAVVALTLVYPALLAGAAAGLGSSLRSYVLPDA